MIPDWDGDVCEAFKLEDAEKWQCYITYKSKVYAVLNGETKNFPRKFAKTMKLLRKRIKSGK